MRCAVPRTLFTNNPALAILAVVFLIGAALFTLGSIVASRARGTLQTETSSPFAWTRGITEGNEVLSWEMRLDLIDRLAIVGAPWCADALRAALDEETDARVREPAERALLVIECRPDFS